MSRLNAIFSSYLAETEAYIGASSPSNRGTHILRLNEV